jgi:small-conductance mechanosensitive channel
MPDTLITLEASALRVWQAMGSVGVTALRIVVILFVAWLLIAVLQRAIRSFRIRIANRFDDLEVKKRAETLGRVFRYLAAVVVSLLAGMLVLGEIGISVAPILGAAGVVGLAVGFGAQSLVKDYFTGLFILLENQIRQGDIVKLGDHGGLVEVVTLRYVQLRDYDGHVHFVPNGQIGSVINLSRGFAYAVIDVGVAYRENVDDVMAVMRQVGAAVREDGNFAELILDELEIAGVEQWADSAVVIRCRFKCGPLKQWAVRREYLRRLKHAFDAAGIEIPFPHLTIYAGQDKQGHAPEMPINLLLRRQAVLAREGRPALGRSEP